MKEQLFPEPLKSATTLKGIKLLSLKKEEDFWKLIVVKDSIQQPCSDCENLSGQLRRGRTGVKENDLRWAKLLFVYRGLISKGQEKLSKIDRLKIGILFSRYKELKVAC